MTKIVIGSLHDISLKTGVSLAESFMAADVVVLCDVSSSMKSGDAPNGRSRYDMLVSELAKIQNVTPGKVAVVGFDDGARFEPGGVPIIEGGSTNLAGGLRFIQPADGTVRFVVISDGFPDDENEALAVAKQFTSKIDVVYVGPEDDPAGRAFLAKLAKASGGKYAESLNAAGLDESLRLLVTGR